MGILDCNPFNELGTGESTLAQINEYIAHCTSL